MKSTATDQQAGGKQYTIVVSPDGKVDVSTVEGDQEESYSYDNIDDALTDIKNDCGGDNEPPADDTPQEVASMRKNLTAPPEAK